MGTTELTLDEIRVRGQAALARELGPSGYIRFMQQFERGEGDYSAERSGWLDGATIHDLRAELGLPAEPSRPNGPQAGVTINLQVLYGILREAAVRGRAGQATGATISYSDLSTAYEKQTGVYHPPHGTWDAPLAELNRRTLAADPPLPPLSAVVTYKPEKGAPLGLPGAGFWGSPGVPAKPRDPVVAWAGILKRVYAADWPDEMP